MRHMNCPALLVPYDPAGLDHLLADCCANGPCKVVSPLGPVKTSPREVPARTAQSFNVDSPIFQEVLSVGRDLVFAITLRDDELFLLQRSCQSNRKFACQMVVASACIAKFPACPRWPVALYRRDRSQCLNRLRNLRPRHAVITIPTLRRNFKKSTLEQLAKMHACRLRRHPGQHREFSRRPRLSVQKCRQHGCPCRFSDQGRRGRQRKFGVHDGNDSPQTASTVQPQLKYRRTPNRLSWHSIGQKVINQTPQLFPKQVHVRKSLVCHGLTLLR